MKAYPISIVITLLMLCMAQFSLSQTIIKGEKGLVHPKATIYNTEVRTVHSAIVGDDYEITVALPKHYESTTTTYGVIYAPDDWLFFRTIFDSHRVLGLDGKLPDLIIVSIGYAHTSTNYDSIITKVADLRTRDMSPYHVDSLDTPSMRARGVKTGGAAKFLSFIKQELMPFVEQNYRASTTDKTFIGYSYGGIFGFYTLFHSPETFSRYLIGSPAFRWASDQNLFIRYEKEYAATHKELPAKVFMSIGSLDEELNGFNPAEKALRSRNYKGLTLKTLLFEGETHLSAPPGTISRGLHELYIAK